MSRWMIDDLGNIRPASQAALIATLGVPSPKTRDEAARLETFAILNVGLIVAEAQANAIIIKCRPSILTERAIAMLGYWLLDHAELPVSISWYDRDWDVEHAPDAKTAISFVSYLLELKRRTPLPPTERIRSQPSIQASRRWHQVKQSVGALTAGPIEDIRYANVLDPLFQGRWTIFEVAPSTNKIEILFRGNGYPLLDPMFAASHDRKSLEPIADEQYQAWVRDGFLEVAKTGRPRFDDVDAVIRWPRFGDLRTRYWRIAVPLRSTPATTIVLNASGNDSGIDLRPKHVEETRQIQDSIVVGHP
jgi:hypothetical protein